MLETPFLEKNFLVSRYVQRKSISVLVRQPQATAYIGRELRFLSCTRHFLGTNMCSVSELTEPMAGSCCVRAQNDLH